MREPSPSPTDRSENDLAEEQGYIDWASQCLERMKERTIALEYQGGDRFARADLERRRAAFLESLRIASAQFIYGRYDSRDGETWYFGIRHVAGGNVTEVAVVDWRAPIATPFFEASRTDPLGIKRRRTFGMEERTLRSLSDEILSPGSRSQETTVIVVPPPPHTRPLERLHEIDLSERSLPQQIPATIADRRVDPAPSPAPGMLTEAGRDLRAPDLILEEFAKHRTGEMHEVVATIQAEQHRLIRSTEDGAVIIQGGPGTGKTVIALHRAAHILYRQRERQHSNSMLVVGPHRAFVDYIRTILPSLGEQSAIQLDLSDLALLDLSDGDRRQIVIRDVDGDATRLLKGHGRMAQIVANAVWAQVVAQDLEFQQGSFHVHVDVAQVTEVVRKLRSDGFPYSNAPREFQDRLEQVVKTQLEEMARGRDGDSFTRTEQQQFMEALRQQLHETRFLERTFRRLNARVVIQRLLTREDELLEQACRDVIPLDRVADLRRPRAQSGRFPWTLDDLPLIAEAHHVITGEARTFGHLVIDEAQDLSPMQWRMVLSHSIRRSVTISGDVDQAIAPYGTKNWALLISRLGLPPETPVHTVTLGYRVPAPVMEFAARLLDGDDAAKRMPRSVREGPDPVILQVPSRDLLASILSAVVSSTGQTAVIAVRESLERISLILAASGISHSMGATGLAAHPLVLLTAEEAKGLEFDHVVVVEPKEFSSRRAIGSRLLFVALTRTTDRLTVIHSRGLPAKLEGSPER